MIEASLPINRERLKEAREALRLSQSALAKAIGVKPQAIQQLEAGTTVRTRHVAKLAAALQRSESWLILGELPNIHAEPGLHAEEVEEYCEFKGLIAGEVWAPEGTQPSGDERIPAIYVEEFEGIRQCAYKVMGQSMNRVVSDGDYVICVPLDSPRYIPAEGDLIIVQRRRGTEVEQSMRRVRKRRGRVELWSESTSAQLETHFTLPVSAKGDSVKVVGLALGKFRPFRSLGGK